MSFLRAVAYSLALAAFASGLRGALTASNNPCTSSAVISGDDSIVIPSGSRSGSNHVPIIASVNTGAAFCVFGAQVAEALNLSLLSGVRQRFRTANSKFEAFGHEVEISAQGVVAHSTVYFFCRSNIEKNVSGRIGWLDRVCLGLIHHDMTAQSSWPRSTACESPNVFRFDPAVGIVAVQVDPAPLAHGNNLPHVNRVPQRVTMFTGDRTGFRPKISRVWSGRALPAEPFVTYAPLYCLAIRTLTHAPTAPMRNQTESRPDQLN